MNDQGALQPNWTVEHAVDFKTTTHGTKRIRCVETQKGIGDGSPAKVEAKPVGRVPRVSRLMALAVHFETLMAEGVVRNQAELAGLGRVSRARVTQIMNFRHLAPDIQEAILLMPRTEAGRDTLRERHLRPIMAQLHWTRQRRLWRELTKRLGLSFDDGSES